MCIENHWSTILFRVDVLWEITAKIRILPQSLPLDSFKKILYDLKFQILDHEPTARKQMIQRNQKLKYQLPLNIYPFIHLFNFLQHYAGIEDTKMYKTSATVREMED